MTLNVFRLAWVNNLCGYKVNDLQILPLGISKWPLMSSAWHEWITFVGAEYSSFSILIPFHSGLHSTSVRVFFDSSFDFNLWIWNLILFHFDFFQSNPIHPLILDSCFVHLLVRTFAIFRMTWHWKLTWWLFISFICSCNLAFEINLSTYLFQDVSSRTVSHAPTIRAVPWPLWSSYVLRPWSSLLSHGS